VRVTVTGGTGYVGAYAVRALVDHGHRPRLLVRDPARLALTVGALGVDAGALDVVTGDMTDAAAVARAVDGADAVVHAAAVVAALNRADAERTVEVNVLGTTTVVDAAIAAGCDPIVHLSSVAALFDPKVEVVHAGLPPALTARNPYTRSKARCDAFVREHQAGGHPLVLVYPGGVSGPPAGEVLGDVAEGFASMLRTGFVVSGDGAVGILDVRDLAEVIAATIEPGRGPRRFMAGGPLVGLPQIAAALRAVTGRRMPVLPTPGIVLRAAGHVVDALRRAAPFDTVFTAEAMGLLTLARPTDDTAVHRDLGVDYRETTETVDAMVRGLHAAGRLSARQVGRAGG
jgi:dihydroflavonol-4-reductase